MLGDSNDTATLAQDEPADDAAVADTLEGVSKEQHAHDLELPEDAAQAPPEEHASLDQHLPTTTAEDQALSPPPSEAPVLASSHAEVQETASAPDKKKRGRPRKHPLPDESTTSSAVASSSNIVSFTQDLSGSPVSAPRRRGRPPKVRPPEETPTVPTVPKKRGRPRKSRPQEEEQEEPEPAPQAEGADDSGRPFDEAVASSPSRPQEGMASNEHEHLSWETLDADEPTRDDDPSSQVGIPSTSSLHLTRTDTTNDSSTGVAIANTVLALATGSASHADTRMDSTVSAQVEDHPSSGIPGGVDITTDSIPGTLLYPKEVSGAPQPADGTSLNQHTTEENESMPIDPLLLQLDASATPQQDQVRYTS